MDGFLTKINTWKKKDSSPLSIRGKKSSQKHDQPKSVEDVVDILQNEPDYDSLIAALKFLNPGKSKDSGFALGTPSPKAAKVLQVLITEIIPNYWQLFKDGSLEEGSQASKQSSNDLDLLLACFRSIAGLNSVITCLRTLIQASKNDAAGANTLEPALNLETVVQVLCEALDGDFTLFNVWTASTLDAKIQTSKRPLSQELLVLIGSGKATSLAAEAETIIKKRSSQTTIGPYWVADGRAYSSWLSRNIVQWMLRSPSDEDARLCAELLTKDLRLGYPDAVIKILLTELLVQPIGHEASSTSFDTLLKKLPGLEQKKVMYLLLKSISNTCFATSSTTAPVSAVAGLIGEIVGSDVALQEHLANWALSPSSIDLEGGPLIRRAVMAVIARDRTQLTTVLDKSIDQFGDQVYVKHTPILQQEGLAQTLLLAAGYVHRTAPFQLKRVMKSALYLKAISNRLSAPQGKARFLGMVVGESLSSLTDVQAKKLDFHSEDMESEEAMAYKQLVRCQDHLGTYDQLRSPKVSKNTPQKPSSSKKAPLAKPAPRPKAPNRPATTGFIIEEVDDDSEDDDIVPLAKPDSDPEDSDEDPTMITRNKPKAPVYIRQLIVYLRDTEDYDHQKLGLTAAPSLIRRKSSHGTEVKEHAEELASILVGLQDKFDLDDFHDLRMQGMIALLIGQPKIMGPWFGRTFFQGDYSISQRASVLTVLGLSARELAGFEESAYGPTSAFPSKKLPQKVEGMYLSEGDSSKALPSSSLKALPSTALDTIAKSVTSSFLAPMAAEAADAAIGPDFLKLSSFKEKASLSAKAKTKPRVRAIPNTTAQLISTSFFFPLTSRFQHAVHTPTVRVRGVLFDSVLLSLFLKTAALLLHAAGPSTLALSDMTTELWDLLLGSSVQTHCAGDITVTGAVLFGLLTLLEVNENRMRDLCRDQSRQVVQTQEWAMRVFENTRGEDGGQENDVKMLAAAVLLRLKEGMEKYQALLMGSMIG